MKRRKWKKFLRSRGTMWVLLGCLAAGAVSGTIYKNRTLPDMEQAAGTDRADGFDMGSDTQKVNGSGNADSSVRNESEISSDGENILAAGEKNGKIADNAGSKGEEAGAASGKGEDDGAVSGKGEEAGAASGKVEGIAAASGKEEKNGAVSDKAEGTLADERNDKNTSDILAANGNADILGETDAEDGDDSADKDDTSSLAKAAPASVLLQAKSLEFLKNDTISWPVQGEVLTEFNMEETVYHPTLNLYRCSPAMIIQSECGTPVSAPADGMILSVGNDEQIGNYIVMDLGSSYQITMGQLMDIHVSEGDLVKEGDLIAYIAQPTACYSVEGDNLYLSMTADKTPVDPLDYLTY